MFNKYFSDQCTLPVASDADPLPDFNAATESILEHIHTTPAEVRKILLGLNISKASGPDGVSNRILRECAESLCFPLSRLFNLSFQHGTFPTCWKLANVVPIFKKNDRQLVNNYRPVSLLCTMSKVLERIVHTRLYEYLTTNNLLTDNNSGFKRSDSTVNQLLLISQKITEALDNKNDACLVFLDISKAFDKVWHRGLLFKLRQFGLGGTALQWVSSYLGNRQQQVTVDGVSSEPLPITAGVPQGSILGPLLFLVYINDLVDNLNCDPHLFADDTFLLDIFNDPLTSSVKVNADLKVIHDWGITWKVQFNPSKTQYMIVSKKPNPPQYPHPVFSGIPIDRKDSHKHLGLIITKTFTWNEHIDCTIVKASRRLYLINCVRFKLPRRSLCSLYKTMVLPIIEYCDIIYDNCTIKKSLALENVQRRAALICTGAYRHTGNDSLLAELGWQPLRIRRQTHKLVLLFKILHSLTPSYLMQIIPRPPQNQYRLRSRTNAALPTPYSRLSSTRNGFVHSTVKLWNSLSDDIRLSDSLLSFKRKLFLKLYTQFNARFIPQLYSFLPMGNAPVYHCRLRLGLSALNFHRFTYNFIDDKSCPNCNHDCENTSHFLFHCPAYAAPRAVLMESLSNHLPDNIIQNLTFLETHILFGSNDVDLQTNLQIFSNVFSFIEATNRFA
jgi:hypothetical protein